LRSKTVHISSAILAAKSPYFYKVISQTFNHAFISLLVSMVATPHVFAFWTTEF
jgi:hypothetical protein